MLRVSNLFGRALRETGQALDRLGLRIAENEIFRETFSRHRPIMNLFDKRPLLTNGIFVAPNASVIGKVLIYDRSSIWYGAVVRGDQNIVKIGISTNVQDRAVINTVEQLDSGFPAEVSIGNFVTIGHGAILTSCEIHDHVLIGQGAIIQEGSVIQSESIVAAGAVVLPGTLIPSKQLWAGNPAIYIRDVTDEEVEGLAKSAESYSSLAMNHAAEFLPFGTVYQHHEKLTA